MQNPPLPASLPRVPWLQNLPISLRLAMALGLLLALLGAVVALALRQSEWLGTSSRQLAETGLRNVTFARSAQSEALLGANHLLTLFLVDEQAQRVPLYTLIDRSTTARNASLDALAATAQDPEAKRAMDRVATTRQHFMAAFDETVEAVELDPRAARPLMAQRTLPALQDMLDALDAVADMETQRAKERLAEIGTLQQQSRLRILGLGAAAVLVAMVSAVLLARTVGRPLEQMARLAGDIARGDMHGPLPPAGRDEIGSLVRALDHMRASLGEREARIAELAFRDSLTGLANRTLFSERLVQAVATAQRTGHPLSVLLLDLDRFKNVNDVLGHDVGDQLLVQVAKRMQGELTRSSDTLARMGGDEFAVLLPTQSSEQAQTVATQLLRALQAPLTLNGQTVDIGGSFGIASFPKDAIDMPTLLARADSAMYVAKQARSGYACFTPAMEPSGAHGLGLLSDLKRAIEDNQLLLVFQPKLNLHDVGRRGAANSTTPGYSAEALLRWHHPERGNVPPDQFIPFAEHTGFIRSITAWVIQRAVQQLAEWQAQGLTVSLNVNISTRDLTQQDLPALVDRQLKRSGVAPERLCLEVTEGAIMEDPPRALAALQALHAMGVRLSIDDFGTGYSSLAYLKKLPVDELKIDRSFVMCLDSDMDDATIVRSTIDLAHNMGLRVVAEGVETDAVLQRLLALGCDEAQGYLFSRPLAAEAFVDWMRKASLAAA